MIYPANSEYLDYASRLVRGGEIIGYPTDTLYGLGVDATNTEAIRLLNMLKGRTMTLSIVVADLENIGDFAMADAKIYKILEKFLPGPFTFLLIKRQSVLSPLVTLDSPLIGIRVPDHDFPRQIVRRTGVPIITTSINRHGNQPLTRIDQIEIDFPQLTIFEDRQVKDSLGSTIVDLTGIEPRIVRQGDGEFPL